MSKVTRITASTRLNKEAMNQVKPSKYRNRKTEYKGIQFDSQKEENRYRELELRERAGEIRNIELQPRYDIAVNGQKICKYFGDFRYEEVATGEVITEDVKGFRTKDYIIKKKLVKAIYNVEIREV